MGIVSASCSHSTCSHRRVMLRRWSRSFARPRRKRNWSQTHLQTRQIRNGRKMMITQPTNGSTRNLSQAKIDVRYVAKLARLALTDAEVEKFGAQLGDLLEHVDAL